MKIVKKQFSGTRKWTINPPHRFDIFTLSNYVIMIDILYGIF